MFAFATVKHDSTPIPDYNKKKKLKEKGKQHVSPEDQTCLQ